MGVRGGGIFEQQTPVLARLREGPGEAARREVAVAPSGPAPSRWTLRTIRATVDWLQPYSLSGVWRVLAGLDLRLRSAQVQQYSPDPAYAAKEAQLHACLREAAAAPGEVVAVFLDEMGYYRWPAAAADWSPAAPAPPRRRRTVGTNSQWRIVGALNALTGQVSYLDNYIVGRQQLVRFYEQLATTYATARRLYVIQDNWSVHEHPDVQAALATWPRLEVVRLPTYAPWLNPIEKLWRWLRQDVLKLHRLAADPTALRQRVRDFLDQFAAGSHEVLQYVGLCGNGRLAHALHPT
jgi:hypothetical protein